MSGTWIQYSLKYLSSKFVDLKINFSSLLQTYKVLSLPISVNDMSTNSILIAYLMMYKPLQSSLYENKEGAIKGTSHLTAKPVHSILKGNRAVCLCAPSLRSLSLWQFPVNNIPCCQRPEHELNEAKTRVLYLC